MYKIIRILKLTLTKEYREEKMTRHFIEKLEREVPHANPAHNRIPKTVIVIITILVFIMLLLFVWDVEAKETNTANNVQQIIAWLDLRFSHGVHEAAEIEIVIGKHTIILYKKQKVLRMNVKHFQTFKDSGAKQYIQWNFEYSLTSDHIGLTSWWRQLVRLTEREGFIRSEYPKEMIDPNWNKPEKKKVMEELVKEVAFWKTQIPKTE